MKLKISSTESTKLRKGGVRVDGDNRTRLDGRCKLDRKKTYNNEFDDKVDNEIDDEIDDKVGKKGQKTFKSRNLFRKLSKSKTITRLNFLTPEARLVFTKLRQVFVKALIFHYFDPERHIRVETDVSGYTIGEVLNQLTLDNLGHWHLVAFFSQKMIFVKTTGIRLMTVSS